MPHSRRKEPGTPNTLGKLKKLDLVEIFYLVTVITSKSQECLRMVDFSREDDLEYSLVVENEGFNP